MNRADEVIERLQALIAELEAERDTLRAQVEAMRATAPMQPVVLTDGLTVRFKENRIVSYLLDYATPRGCGMNELARLDFSDDERMQFAQLIGYSVSGYGNLSYVTDESYERAAAQVEAALQAKP